MSSPLDRPAPPALSASRQLTVSLALLVTSVLVAAMVVLPSPYSVRSPGPTRDTLGSTDGHALIEISGAQTHPSSGRLLLTTVSALGSPQYQADLVHAVRGWFSSESSVYPLEAVFTPGRTQQQIDDANEADMISSQETATVAALTELGYDVPATLRIAGTPADSRAKGLLEEGDVVRSVAGRDIATYQDLIDALAAQEPGETVAVGVERDGSPVDVEVVAAEGPQGQAMLGVYVDPSFDLPVDVDIRIDDIGGPSAGMMFSLGIIDLLTPEDEVAGEVVAGTGTITVDGRVGPIGGLQQKLYGAARDGARWFLAAEDNCSQEDLVVPDGLRVLSVGTLAQARAAMSAIGAGTAGELTTCADARRG